MESIKLLFFVVHTNNSELFYSCSEFILCLKKFVLVFSLFSFFIVLIIMEKNKMKLDPVIMRKVSLVK